MSRSGRFVRAAGRAAVHGGALAGQGLAAVGRAAAGAAERRRGSEAPGRAPDTVVDAALTALDLHHGGEALPAGTVPSAVCCPQRPRRLKHAREAPDLRLVPVGPDEPRRPPPAPSSLVNAVLDLLDPADPSVVVGGLLLRVPPEDRSALAGPLVVAADFAFAYAADALLGGEGGGDSAPVARPAALPWEPMALFDASGALLAVQPAAGDGGSTSKDPTHLTRSPLRYAPSGDVLVQAQPSSWTSLFRPDGTVATTAVDGVPRSWADGGGTPLGHVRVDADSGLRHLEPAGDPDATSRLLLLVAWLMPPSRLTAATW